MNALGAFSDNADIEFAILFIVTHYPRSDELLVLQIPIDVILNQFLRVVVDLEIKRTNRV